MKQLKTGLLLAAGILTLTSCGSDDFDFGQGQGILRLKLLTSAEVAVSSPTRADEVPLTAPDAGDFAVRLTKSDNSYSKSWNSIDDFNAEPSFNTGSYTLEAFVGDIENEGFDAPYFYGVAQVSVIEAKEVEASLTASLANSMVSIDYTEGFRNYFKDYSARIHSAGHSYIDFAADESRPAFIAPGEVDLTVSFTNPQGNSTSLQPTGFMAKPRHFYRVHFDVTEGTGGAVLKITFDDSLVNEDVTIDLTEELFTTPAPEIKSEGFVSESPIEILEGNLANSLIYTVVARGGLQEANLTFDTPNAPAWGREVNLVNASQTLQSQLESAGINAMGFYRNPDKFGRLDITDYVKALPAGIHKITLVAKDRFTRVSEPVTLVVSTEEVTLTATVAPVVFGTDKAYVTVNYNGENPQNSISFKALDQFGIYRDCPIEEVSETTTRAFPSRNYLFTVTLPDKERDAIPMQVFYNGVKKLDIVASVVTPEYSVQPDPFSNRVVLKIVPGDQSELPSIINALRVKVSSTSAPANASYTFVRDVANGQVIVNGCQPNTDYVMTTMLSSAEDAKPLTSSSFRTEPAASIPNGDFADIHETINMQNVPLSGPYTGTLLSRPTYQTKTSIVRSEPTGWASINPLTCYAGAANINTWFCVPSTFSENGETIIRSVAYDHNGTTPKVDTRTAKYYNNNTPSFSDNNKAAGELFLGSYSFNGAANRSEGIAFESRPASLSFDYRYAPINNETAKVEISVLDASGKVIASGSSLLHQASSTTSMTVPFSSYSFGSRAATLKVKFLSSSSNIPAINIPTGDSGLSEGTGLSNRTKGANDYKAFASGSVLTIDNVKLNY